MENRRILVRCIKDCHDIKNGDIVELEEYGSYISYIRDIRFATKQEQEISLLFNNINNEMKQGVNNACSDTAS